MKLVKRSTTSAFWWVQFAQHTQLSPQSDGRTLFTDIFYTRHMLAMKIESLKDGEAKLLETVRFSNIDSLNRSAVKEAVGMLTQKDVGLG